MNEREYDSMYAVEDTHWWYVSLHELICSYVAGERNRKGAPLDILDAGCGTGRLMQLMQPYGTVEGFDLSERALGFCRERGLANIRQANLNDVEPGETRYDIITSIDVIYHRAVQDESGILTRFYRSLKPGGLLIVNLPAFEFLRSTHDIAVHTRRRYTRGELENLLIRCGFAVEKSSYRIAFLFPFIAGYRLARRFLPHPAQPGNVASDVSAPSPLLNVALLFSSRMENALQRRIDLSFGSSVFMVVRRPR